MIDETVREIEEMDTQSASIVAVKAAKALLDLVDREAHSVEEFQRTLERNSGALQRANRSHAPLYTTQQRIVDAVAEADPDTVAAAKAVLEAAVDEVVTEVESSKAAAAERAATLIEDGDVLLTHENSSTVMATLEQALDDGKQFELYVTESRPRYLGRRTARQLRDRDGVDVTLVVDGAAGYAVRKCDRVLVGMNCLIEDRMYNRIGTYPIVATAADQGVPVAVVASSAKFIGGGFTFQNTYRSPSEVMLEPPEGFAVENPGYDEVPTRLLDVVVTEDTMLEF
ncbi:translation initiation factor eIF-2B [Halomicroarcula sp. GCM10025709]|uniref:translation initiation factor eIF-2B n=1 Tax=Haloarcula TaxID=2237 RepID=UPI0024C2D140|nr:translation initiation factor eIF-2B [Halomicroarcula sp. YJ-61-S]